MGESIKIDNDEDLAYCVQYGENCGRFLQAARDFSPGDVLFSDKPVAICADNPVAPFCLACHSIGPALVFRCDYCDWPLCSIQCKENPEYHARECSLFRKHKFRLAIPK